LDSPWRQPGTVFGELFSARTISQFFSEYSSLVHQKAVRLTDP